MSGAGFCPIIEELYHFILRDFSVITVFLVMMPDFPQ